VRLQFKSLARGKRQGLSRLDLRLQNLNFNIKGEESMTQQHYIIIRKTNMVELGKILGNISEACRKLGVSRQHYYDIKGTIEEEGLSGLLEKSRMKPRFSNRVSPEIEKEILDFTLAFPIAGQVTVSNELKKNGVMVSPGGVRGVWLRHEL